KDEVHWAIENRDGKIIPALLQECDARDFHLRMPRLQHVDFRKDPKEARRRLLALLGVTPVHGPAPLLPDLKSAEPQRWRRRWWAVGIGVSAAALLGCIVVLQSFVGGNGPTPTSPAAGGERRPAVERAVVSTRQPIGLRGQLQLL